MRSVLYELEPLVSRLPTIKTPKHRVLLQKKIIITCLALVLFFIMMQIPLYGVRADVVPLYGQLRFVVASGAGSLMELGIAPILTAGIFMQLLVGSKIIGLDLTNSKDRVLFTGVQKLLAILMAVFTGSMLVLAGRYGVGIGSQAGIFIIIQLTLGTIILIYLDELVSKYGFGSGICLFIVGSFAMTVVWGALNPVVSPYGAVPHFAGTMLGGGDFASAFFRLGGLPSMMGLLATILIFFIVVYFERIRIEIPIVHKRFGEIRGHCSIKLLYTSVIPIILVMIVFANINFLARVSGTSFLGTYDAGGNLTGGLAYYTSAPSGIQGVIADPIRAAVYAGILIVLCMGFAWFWVKATSMGSQDLSEQFKRLGISPLGSSTNAEESNQVLARQIMTFALLGGALVGGLTVLADFTGALGSGLMIILAVGILYRLYGEAIREHALDIETWRRNKVKFEGKVCPVCGSGSFTHSGTFSGWTFPRMHTAQKYLCKNCGYAGSIALELRSESDIEKLNQNYSRKIKDGTGYSQPIFSHKWIPFWKILTILFIIWFIVLPILMTVTYGYIMLPPL